MTTKKKNVAEVVAAITRQAEQHTADLRVYTEVAVGDIIRQGDIYIQRVGDKSPRGREAKTKQLAPGHTKGSRHVVEGAEVFETPNTRDMLAGPIVVATQAWRLTHPEHPDYELPAGTYRTGYQLDPRTRQRVAD